MNEINKCLSCKYAQFYRNKSGALHPSGDGLCIWNKKLAFPASMADFEISKIQAELGRSRYISRKEPIQQCDVYQPVTL